MRSYPVDSPLAAARIVSLALVADGHVSMAELDALDRVDAYGSLRLDGASLHEVMKELCEDMLACQRQPWSDTCVIDPATLDALLDEIRSPALRLEVLRVCDAVVRTDGHVAHGETVLLARAMERWGLVDAAEAALPATASND